jgi:hypothetical protein
MTQTQQNQEQVQPKKSRVDDILVGIATGNKELINPKPTEKIGSEDTYSEPVLHQSEKQPSEFQKDKEEFIKTKTIKKKSEPDAPAIPKNDPAPKPIPAAAQGDTTINEYGLPEPEKPVEEKMYPESVVNKMIRERLERVKIEATPAQVKEIAKDMNANPADSEAWMTELENVIVETIEKKERNKQVEIMKQKENSIQAQFEDRFNTGMAKYSDYWKVVNSVGEIKPHMLIATRSMEKPADFLYAAAKFHPDKLKEIAGMDDPYGQMMEIGRLDERMRKASTNITKAPAPIKRHASESFERESDSAPPEKTIDEKILEHAKAKRGIK